MMEQRHSTKTKESHSRQKTKTAKSSSNSQNIICPRCAFEMGELSACHLRCTNCGAEMDCSDKGSVW